MRYMRPNQVVHKENMVFQSSHLFLRCFVEPNQNIQTAGPFSHEGFASMNSEFLLETKKMKGKEHGLDVAENDVLGCFE